MSEIKAPDELLKAQWIANITDTAVRIPILNINVGLDFLIGLIPGFGDAVMTLVALRIVYLGKKLGMPKHLLRKMVRNSLLDFGLGFIPVVGDLVDLFYKANKRNVRLMERWWLQQNQSELARNTQAKLDSWQAPQD
ncbi:DUF4112 domain-containing protein [Planctobacterium marinum]|uniref:DUF4112 domain-containing protein n=1 Tax=Planctobacterium marinum TaxID=1631968 RepID=A0AA48HIK6_9ALTE|nr:hypothetical protein MACH26_08570 [Planctobacterium marinum]